MASIRIKRTFTMSQKELRAKLDELVAQIGEKTEADCRWKSGHCLDFKLGGAEGQVNIRKKELEVTVRLGLMISAFKGRIERELGKYLDEHVY